MRGLQADGVAIRLHRRDRKWTQEHLASIAGVASRTIRSAERGKRLDIGTLKLLADAFDLPISAVTVAESANIDSVDKHKQLVRKWHAAYLAKQIDVIMKFHHDDAELLLPGSSLMPGECQFRGPDELRRYYTAVFDAYSFHSVQDERIEGFSDLVFHRVKMTTLVAATGLDFTSVFLNEFQFVNQKIIRWTNVSDLTGLRDVLPKDSD